MPGMTPQEAQLTAKAVWHWAVTRQRQVLAHWRLVRQTRRTQEAARAEILACFQRRADIFHASKLHERAVHAWLWILIQKKSHRVKSVLAQKHIQVCKMRAAAKSWRLITLQRRRTYSACIAVRLQRVWKHWMRWRRVLHHELCVHWHIVKRTTHLARQALCHWHAALIQTRMRVDAVTRFQAAKMCILVRAAVTQWRASVQFAQHLARMSQKKTRNVLERALESWRARTEHWAVQRRRRTHAASLFHQSIQMQVAHLFRQALHIRQHRRRVEARHAQWSRMEAVVVYFRAWKNSVVTPATRNAAHRKMTLQRIHPPALERDAKLSYSSPSAALPSTLTPGDEAEMGRGPQWRDNVPTPLRRDPSSQRPVGASGDREVMDGEIVFRKSPPPSENALQRLPPRIPVDLLT